MLTDQMIRERLEPLQAILLERKLNVLVNKFVSTLAVTEQGLWRAWKKDETEELLTPEIQQALSALLLGGHADECKRLLWQCGSFCVFPNLPRLISEGTVVENYVNPEALSTHIVAVLRYDEMGREGLESFSFRFNQAMFALVGDPVYSGRKVFDVNVRVPNAEDRKRDPERTKNWSLIIEVTII